MELPFGESGGKYFVNPGDTSDTSGVWTSGTMTSRPGPGFPFPTGSGWMFSGSIFKTFLQLYNPVVVEFRWFCQIGASFPDVQNVDFVGHNVGANFQVAGDGRPSFTCQNGGVNYTSAPFSFTFVAGQYYHVGYQISVADSAAGGGTFNAIFSWIFKVNGVVISTGTTPAVGGSTSGRPSDGFSRLNLASGTTLGFIGDLHMQGTPTLGGVGPPAKFFGDDAIVPLFDRQDVTTTWTPLVAGPHKAMLRDQPPGVQDGNATYVSTTTSGNREDALMDQVSPYTGAIDFVSAFACMENDVGSGIQCQQTYSRGPTTFLADGPAAIFAPSANSYRFNRDAQQYDPILGGTNLWTAANVDATAFGAKKL